MLDLKKFWLFNTTLVCAIVWTGMCQFAPDVYTRHKYACDSQTTCLTNLYSIECSLGEKIAVKGVFYGAKPYTNYCPEAMSCVTKKRCCEYHKDDCLLPYGMNELWDIFMECSQGQQCGWLRARSIELKEECQIRKKSNYIRADFQCISDTAFIDVCSQHTISAKSVHLHHTSIFPGIYNYDQCSCLITPDDCNTTASLKFRSIDVRLHSKGNFSKCDRDSRVELIGQSELKQYHCKPKEFLYGFEDFHTSTENNMVFYLYKKPLQFPSKLWMEVQATSPGVNVRVTCGPRSVQTAKRCPAMPISAGGVIDEVDELPTKDPNTPSVIYISPGDGDGSPGDTEPGEKPSTALAALIGGIAAGVVVLILFLIVICIMLRKKQKRKEKADQVSYKQCLPYSDEPQPQMNYYETVNDPDNKSVTLATSNAGSHIYHQPWEQRPGISMQNRAQTGDLAYATSEEIKVLIENMERDRKFLSEGEDKFPLPDSVYYRHINDYRYIPEDDSEEDDDEEEEEEVEEDHLDGKNDSETESKSVNSEHSGTEKVESEDSKVEADRAIDSDCESQRQDMETVSEGFDGYESPRVSSFLPSDTSSNCRSSNRYSDYRSEFHRLVSQSSSVIAEDSDPDVPLEYAPPLAVAMNQSEISSNLSDQSENAKDKEVSLGSYGEPRVSSDSGQGVDSGSDFSGHYYSSVYDKVTDGQTKL